MTEITEAEQPPQEGAGEPVDFEALLMDPNAVHLNMLRGGIAKLTPAQIGHLYRGEEAEEVIREVRRQNPTSPPTDPRTKALEEALRFYADQWIGEPYGDEEGGQAVGIEGRPTPKLLADEGRIARAALSPVQAVKGDDHG
jgi:hypothetical protein